MANWAETFSWELRRLLSTFGGEMVWVVGEPFGWTVISKLCFLNFQGWTTPLEPEDIFNAFAISRSCVYFSKVSLNLISGRRFDFVCGNIHDRTLLTVIDFKYRLLYLYSLYTILVHLSHGNASLYFRFEENKSCLTRSPEMDRT